MPYSQSTLKRSVAIRGVGLHSGIEATLTLHPAAAGTGIMFRRVDVGGEAALVPARYDLVAHAAYGTTLRNAAGTEARTVEHLMAALWAEGVDNVVVEMDGPEVPILDGSSAPFIALIEEAGLRALPAVRHVLKVCEPVEVRDGTKWARLEPFDGFEIACEIEFAEAAIGRQAFTFDVDRWSFKHEVARARTFTQLRDVEMLQANGLALGGSLANAVVIDDDKVLNPEGLRFADECVRHKALDVLGDLALAGAPIRGRFSGFKCGHALNNALLRAFFAAPHAYERVPAGYGVPRAMDIKAAAAPV